MKFTGNRYMYSGHVLPELKDFIVKHIHLDFKTPKLKQKDMEIDDP